MHKDWQGIRICANPFTLELKTPRNLILCGELKGQVAQGKVRYVRNVSVTHSEGTFSLTPVAWTASQFPQEEIGPSRSSVTRAAIGERSLRVKVTWAKSG